MKRYILLPLVCLGLTACSEMMVSVMLPDRENNVMIPPVGVTEAQIQLDIRECRQGAEDNLYDFEKIVKPCLKQKGYEFTSKEALQG